MRTPKTRSLISLFMREAIYKLPYLDNRFQHFARIHLGGILYLSTFPFSHVAKFG
jgi:hypothetical protein